MFKSEFEDKKPDHEQESFKIKANLKQKQIHLDLIKQRRITNNQIQTSEERPL